MVCAKSITSTRSSTRTLKQGRKDATPWSNGHSPYFTTDSHRWPHIWWSRTQATSPPGWAAQAALPTSTTTSPRTPNTPTKWRFSTWSNSASTSAEPSSTSWSDLRAITTSTGFTTCCRSTWSLSRTWPTIGSLGCSFSWSTTSLTCFSSWREAIRYFFVIIQDYKNHSEKVLKGIYVFGFALWVFFRIFVFCYAFIYAFDYGISEVMVPKMDANHPPIFK